MTQRVDVQDVVLDPDLLVGVLTELVANALEACPEGPVSVIVAVRESSLVIEVLDLGTGLTEKARQHAFDPFFSERPAGRGRGLGLTRAQRMAVAMGGAVMLEDGPGRGVRAILAARVAGLIAADIPRITTESTVRGGRCGWHGRVCALRSSRGTTMARRRNVKQEQIEMRTPGPLGRARVLVLSPARDVRDGIATRLAALGVHANCACDVGTARIMLNESFYDVVVVGDADGEAGACVEDFTACERAVSCVVLGSEVSMDLAVAVMRAGGVDLLAVTCSDSDLAASLELASARARCLRAKERLEERRARKLRGACRELTRSKNALMGQLGSVCSDMAAGYQDLSEQMKQVSLASELNTIFRQELDLECLLRTVLEYTLKKVGPTNAAIFLPAQSGDFTLGAYVNYDCPRDTAETLLDHLADIIAPAFENRNDVAVMRGLTDLADTPSPGGEWLEDSSVAAFSCRQDGECLAVVVLFRDRRSPYNAAASQTMRVIKDLFGQQLARIVKMHHRHLPKHQWGGFFGEQDDQGMAA